MTTKLTELTPDFFILLDVPSRIEMMLRGHYYALASDARALRVRPPRNPFHRQRPTKDRTGQRTASPKQEERRKAKRQTQRTASPKQEERRKAKRQTQRMARRQQRRAA